MIQNFSNIQGLQEYERKRNLLLEKIKTKTFQECEKDLADLWRTVPYTVDMEDYELYGILKDNFVDDPHYQEYLKKHSFTIQVDDIGKDDVYEYQRKNC